MPRAVKGGYDGFELAGLGELGAMHELLDQASSELAAEGVRVGMANVVRDPAADLSADSDYWAEDADGFGGETPEWAARLGLRRWRPWDWFFAEQPLPGTLPEYDERVVEIDVTDPAQEARVRAFLAVASPDTEALDELPDHTWYGMEDGEGALVATLAVSPTGADHLWGKAPHRAYLLGFAVDPATRGQGLGSILMREVVRRRIDLGDTIHFGVWADNLAARRLYERIGVVDAMRVDVWLREE